MKYCRICGKANEDQVRYCSQCGQDLEEIKPSDEPIVQETTAMPVYRKPAKYSGMSIAGFIVSLVGFIIFPIVFGPLGLGLSLGGIITSKGTNNKGKGLAITGIIISIVNIVYAIYMLASQM